MRLAIACLALGLSLCPARAGAVIYDVSFSGTIESIAVPLDDGTFQLGGAVSGSFQIDADVPDGEPLPDVVNLDQAVLDFSVSFVDTARRRVAGASRTPERAPFSARARGSRARPRARAASARGR